jgi:hypothetical protein
MIANPPTSQIWGKRKRTLLVTCSLNMGNSQKTIPQNVATLVHSFHQKNPLYKSDWIFFVAV